MKPRVYDSSSRSCSCTSCFYKSESEHPSVRRMLAKGSRIDKLFIGKYLPLREEKLLDRLVRTRAIYDDIRTQLLSDSKSESDKGDLKPAKQMPLKREGRRKDEDLSDAEKSSVLLQLINLVDRGATLGPHRLSECCSCCVCGSKGDTFAETGRPQKHKRHRHASSLSSFTSGMRTHDERRLASHGHRARYIRSDPCNCTCTNEDCDLNVQGSKTIIKSNRKPGFGSKELVIEKKVGGRQIIKGYKTRRGMGETFRRSITKLKKSKSQMSAKLKSKIKKSMEIMKAAKQEVKGEIRKHTKRYKHSEVLYSLRGGKRRKKTKEELDLEVEDTISKIKKDSLTKIREDMKKKNINEEWACDFKCDPEECKPEDCLEIKMQQRKRQGEKRVHYKEKNIGDTNRILSKTRISQTKISKATTKTETKKQETESADLKKNTESNEPQVKSKNAQEETETNKPQLNRKNEVVCECKTTTSSTNTSKRSITELPSTTTKTSASETIRQKRTKPKATVIQAPKKNVGSGGYALKRCFCTLKLKPKIRIEPQHSRNYDSRSAQTKTSKIRSTTASTLVICECEQPKGRNVKSVQAHSSEKVEKLRPSEQLVIKKKDDELTSNKQAVRISSNFSFNIEFYKETPSTQKIATSETETHSQVSHPQKRTHKRHRKVGKHRRLTDKPSQMSSSAKSKNTLTKLNLRRCFCTLKLAKKDGICECAPNAVTYSKGTLTSGQSFTDKPILRNMGTEKRLKRPKYAKYQILPYECEPGICVPGECDPYQCLEVINKRNAKQTSRCSGTCNRKTKSTYSITERRGGRSKTKKVQSVSATHKKDKSLVIPQRKVASSPNRQAVRFGSSFSFDIEFYKDKPRDIQQDFETVKEPSSSVKMKTQGSRQKHKTKHHRSTLIQSHTKEKGIYVGSTMKRCFCTLKLQKKAKKQVVNCECSTTATETVPIKETIHPDMVTRSTQMKNKRFRHLGLLPYECEPGFCVPGECDPNQCLERIKMRNKKVKDFGTGTYYKNKSATSTTSSSKSRNALTQSNFGETRKKRKRSKYTTSLSYPKVAIPVKSTSSRQAVLIGSNFSFHVEFARKEPQEAQLPDKPFTEKQDRNVRMQENGENPNKMILKHSETQSAAVKKKNKGSRIKPMLKRCFCTLKLRNNKANLNHQILSKPAETIVMPVQVFNKSFALSQYTNHTKYIVRKKKVQPNHIGRSSLQSSLPMVTTSKSTNWYSKNITTLSTVSPFNITEILNKEGRGSRSLQKLLSKENNKTTEINLRRAQLIGVSPYLKKSFYALNVHVQNQHKKLHKLLPYECEPGVCVPGECDPHECLKRINKRLLKRSSTMTTTGNRSQSTSSGGTCVRSSQQQFGRTRQERADKGRDRVVRAPRAIKYESPPTQTHKQAVCVGSTFSFDIEFFKNKSSPGNKDVVKEKRKRDHNVGSEKRNLRRNHKGTRGSQILRRDTPSQSSIMTHNKGQNITRPKRCFCTLKLQKRGKQHVQVGHEAKPQVQYTTTGQNTKNRHYKLDPNECEPGVCIPGECDPYECLKRIKKRRKDFGGGMRPNMMSSSSMTNQTKNNARGKHVQIKGKRRRAGDSKSTLSSVSRPRVNKTSEYPCRQAVRIGSNFSFNIEFYKDKSHGQGDQMTVSGPGPMKVKTRTKDHNQNTIMRRSQSSVGRSSQGSTTLRHQITQHGPNTKAIGTKTGAFFKRCFCTAKFFQKSPPNGVKVVGVPANVKATPSLMQRCMCTLKLLTAKSKPKHAPKLITSMSSQTDKIKENKIRPMNQQKLEPYECEPGICVPGQCDPYKCLERINKRNGLNKMSSTENAGTKSTSTGFRSSKSTGSYARMRAKEKRHGDHGGKQKYSQPVSTPVVKPVTTTPSLNRNVVRIGSNFSFNIEFYKDQISPTYQNIQRAAKEVKKKRHSKSATASDKAQQRTKTRGLNKYDQKNYSRESQVDLIKKEDRATGMLKRCFCTLALQKQTGRDKVVHEKALIVKEQGTESPYYKTYPTVENKNTLTKRPFKLDPYECEPGVCIPGECDPHECLKRIQRRREQGTSTPRHRTSSSSTLMRQRRKLRDHHAQSVTRHKKVARPSQQRTRPSRAPGQSQQIHYGDQRQHRQAVKIGSNFSFNIEFSKSRTGGDQAVKIMKEPRADRHETRSTFSKPEGRRSTRSTKSQGRRRVRDSGSQGLRDQVRSTLTETKPFLKRCFCTLMYKNMDKKPHGTNKKPEVIKPPTVTKYTQHREMGVATPKEKPFKNLLPYECEPGVCVPGQCDPNECLKRIEKRNMQTKMAYTDKPKGRGVSTVTAETKTSSKGFQNQTDYRPKRTNGRGGRVTPVKKQAVTHSERNKQAVRVGSSFSFDVEFSKGKTNKTPFQTNTPNVYSTLVSTKNITTDRGSKKYRTAMSNSDRKLINRQSQSVARKTASSGSGAGPLLKRCFCTLKLQKLGRLQRQSRLRTDSKITQKPISTNKTLNPTVIKYKDTGMGTKKKYRDLLPYECEPNICIPGQCNPYECLERIKKRNMCDSTTNCMNRNTKSVSSLAGRKFQIRKSQTLSDKPGGKNYNEIRSKDRKKNVDLTETDNGHNQAVRLGSNFSFNVEFYKEHTPKIFKNVTFDTLPKIDKAYNTRDEKPRTISRGSFYQGQSNRHKELQARVGQEHKASGNKPLLQKCFCTLKLLEGNKQKPPGPDVQPSYEAKPSLKYKNTGQNTKKHHQYILSDLDPNECEPGVCVPGKCDPYECLQRIKRRNIRHMATEVCSGDRRSQTSITSFGPISKSKKIQYSPKEKGQGAKLSNIVEQPRFPFLEPQYYQGLKIGSNVSVNIEFYKEYALPTDEKETEKISRQNKNVARDRNNQTISKSDINKGSSMNTSTMARNRIQQAGVKTENKSSFVGNALKRCFCTAKLVGRKSLVTVGRVDKLITNSPFQPRKFQIYQMYQDKAKNQNTHCDPNCIVLKSRTQNAATKINDKYFSGDPLNANQPGNKNSDEMKTILPYAPKKFNKHGSKTLVMHKKKSNKKDSKETGSSNKNNVTRSKSAKRLTGKQEKTLITNQNGLKRFMCACINTILKSKNKSNNGIECNFKIDDDNNNTKVKAHLKMSKSERKADAEESLKVSKTKKKQNNHIKKSKSLNAKNTKITSTKPFVCPHCQAYFDNKSNISELKKAGGDVRTSEIERTPEEMTKGKEKQNENKSQSKGRQGPCCVCKDKTRLGTKNLDAKLYGLKVTKAPRIAPPKVKKRTPMIKEGKIQGKKVTRPRIAPPEVKKKTTMSKDGKIQGKKVTGKETQKKPCVCGSSVCAKLAKKEKLAKTAQTLQKPKKTDKPCVCGSPVCAKEAKKMRGSKDTKGSKKDNKKTKKVDKKKKINENLCECIHSKKKIEEANRRKKIADAELLQRRKQYAKEDALLKAKRRKKEVEMYKKVLKTKNAGDCALLTESMLDIAKLGCTTTKDVLRSTCRTIMDPKNTAQNLKTCVRDPRRGLTNIKQAFGDSGLGSTCKRVFLRFKMMKRFKSAQDGLESCPATNYLIHIADADPKKRLKPKKKKKKRVPVDFECSPYMASLRNRPFLSVYYACPWFYPHCLSMLNVWRQFTDILLFLLAVVVWSPCILLMEVCRAMMCCFMCTG